MIGQEQRGHSGETLFQATVRIVEQGGDPLIDSHQDGGGEENLKLGTLFDSRSRHLQRLLKLTLIEMTGMGQSCLLGGQLKR